MYKYLAVPKFSIKTLLVISILFFSLFLFVGGVKAESICVSKVNIGNEEGERACVVMSEAECNRRCTNLSVIDPNANVVECQFYDNRTCSEFIQTAEDQESNSNIRQDVLEKIKGLNRLGVSGGRGIQTLIGRIIRIIMQVVGTIALLIFVAGGIMWMTARGNAEQAGKATKTLMWASLGIILILSSYVLVEFLFGAF